MFRYYIELIVNLRVKCEEKTNKHIKKEVFHSKNLTTISSSSVRRYDIYIYTILWTTSRIDNTFSNLFMWKLREEMHGNIEKKVDFCFSMCKVQNHSPFSHR